MKSNFSVCFITELRNSCHFKPSWCTLLNFLLPVLHTLSKEALAHKRVFFPVELWTWEESRATDNENFPSLALHPLHMKRNCPLWKFSIYLFLFFFFFCHGWIILWLQMEPSAGKEALMCPRIYCRIPSAFSVFFFSSLFVVDHNSSWEDKILNECWIDIVRFWNQQNLEQNKEENRRIIKDGKDTKII